MFSGVVRLMLCVTGLPSLVPESDCKTLHPAGEPVCPALGAGTGEQIHLEWLAGIGIGVEVEGVDLDGLDRRQVEEPAEAVGVLETIGLSGRERTETRIHRAGQAKNRHERGTTNPGTKPGTNPGTKPPTRTTTPVFMLTPSTPLADLCGQFTFADSLAAIKKFAGA